MKHLMFDLGKIQMNYNFRMEGVAQFFLLYKVLTRAITEIKPLRYNQTCSLLRNKQNNPQR